jgi:hypothetical protein
VVEVDVVEVDVVEVVVVDVQVLVIKLVFSHTAPLRAINEPELLAPVLAVIESLAKIIPLKSVAVPNVAELPTFQIILHA